jgi:hypothetical protein
VPSEPRQALIADLLSPKPTRGLEPRTPSLRVGRENAILPGVGPLTWAQVPSDGSKSAEFGTKFGTKFGLWARGS